MKVPTLPGIYYNQRAVNGPTRAQQAGAGWGRLEQRWVFTCRRIPAASSTTRHECSHPAQARQARGARGCLDSRLVGSNQRNGKGLPPASLGSPGADRTWLGCRPDLRLGMPFVQISELGRDGQAVRPSASWMVQQLYSSIFPLPTATPFASNRKEVAK